MNLLRTAIKSSVSIQIVKPSLGLPRLLRESPKHFSSVTEAPPPAPPPIDASIDAFLRPQTNGAVYGRLYGITRSTLKSDILNLLEGCELRPNDIKVNYSNRYMPVAMVVRFPSFNAFDGAFKMIGKKGRLYRLDRVERNDWDIIIPYDGKTVLLQNVPRTALTEDVERFLSGCEYEVASINFILRQGFPDSVKWATVRFQSQTHAMNAFMRKNRGFCLNHQITVRMLQ